LANRKTRPRTIRRFDSFLPRKREKNLRTKDRAFILFRRRDFDLRYRRAREDAGPIHVLDDCAWENILAGRHRANDIGEREIAYIVVKIDRSDEPVVTRFRDLGPGKRAGPGIGT